MPRGRGFEAAFAARWRRRRRAGLAHLGIAVALVGLAAQAAVEQDTAVLAPGEELWLATPAGSFSVTYLGLSRYQVGDRDKQVASLTLRRDGAGAALVTPALVFDWDTREQLQRPAIVRGLMGDVIVDLTGLPRNEAIACRLTFRPLASLVWMAAALLLAAGLEVRRTLW